MRRARAKVLTALGASFSPRPCRASGRVRTRPTSNPAARIAASAVAANGGVPANPTRNASATSGSAREPLFFPELRRQPRPLQRREVGDEYLPDQVVHLVLDAHRESPLEHPLEGLAALVERSHCDPGGAPDPVIDP